MTANFSPCTRTNKTKGLVTDLRDTLAVLATVQNGPGNAAGVLALEEERLGLAVLEAEDLAVATDVQLTLNNETDISNLQIPYQKTPQISLREKKKNPKRATGTCRNNWSGTSGRSGTCCEVHCVVVSYRCRFRTILASRFPFSRRQGP